MPILSQHVLSCLMLSQVVLCVPTVVYMCLEWPCENGVLFRDSAGIKRVLYRTLFGCCSDLPGECSGALRRNAKKVRTKSVVIPAQDRTDTGCRLHGVQELYLTFYEYRLGDCGKRVSTDEYQNIKVSLPEKNNLIILFPCPFPMSLLRFMGCKKKNFSLNPPTFQHDPKRSEQIV
jgi:hypothetical protein